MKKDQQCDANGQAGDHATPKPPVTPRLCLIVLGHGATLLALCRRAKRKWLGAAVANGVISEAEKSKGRSSAFFGGKRESPLRPQW